MAECTSFIVLALFLLVLAVRCHGGSSESSQRCPQHLPSTSSMQLFRNTCYQFVSEEKFWPSARDYCSKYGGHLVKINDVETNQVIVSTLNDLWWNNHGVWIGLHDTASEMSWKWLGHDSGVQWTNWGHGHPGAAFHHIRDCVRMVRNDGWRWHETPCSGLKWHYRFICQYKASAIATSNSAVVLRPTTTAKKRDPSTTVITTTLPTKTQQKPETSEPTTKKQTTFVFDHGIKLVNTKLTDPRADNRNSAKVEDREELQGPNVGALMSSRVESHKESEKKNLLAIVMPTIFICLLTLFLLVVFWRRRRKNLQKIEAYLPGSPLPKEITKDDSEKVDGVLLNVTKAQSLANKRAVSNLYIDAETKKFYSEGEDRPSVEPVYTLPQKPNNDYFPMNGCTTSLPVVPFNNRASYMPMTNPVSYANTASPDDVDGKGESDDVIEVMTAEDEGIGYDVPKLTHIYSEIPEADRCEDDNVYEDLDNIRA